jgi:hypothetical protein
VDRIEESTYEVAVDLRRTVEASATALLAISEADSAVRPAPRKWSPKEIIGHLIDSAANNHQRFVRAQLQEELVFPGYDQDAWVEVQRYQEASWPALVALWKAYNLHIADVMERVPERERLRVRERHNLDRIAWQTVSADQPTTLDYFMRDYVGHLKHHLRQVLAREGAAATARSTSAS